METLPSHTNGPHDSSDLDISGEDIVMMEILITADDVAEMEYYLNECPMANMAINNAVAFALRRVLKPDVPVSVTFRKGRPTAKLDDREIHLGREICAWMAKILMGSPVRPLMFRIEIPKSLLPAKRRQLDLLPPSLRHREAERVALGA